MTQSKSAKMPVDSKKKVAIAVLSVVGGMLCASGVFFTVYSYINNISFQVINTQISGMIFGVAVIYLGARNLMSLANLKKELYKPTSRFSWENFKNKKN